MVPDSFKLAVLSRDEFSDEEVEKLFLNLKVGNETEIQEGCRLLENHRPEVIRSLMFQYLKNPVC